MPISQMRKLSVQKEQVSDWRHTVDKAIAVCVSGLLRAAGHKATWCLAVAFLVTGPQGGANTLKPQFLQMSFTPVYLWVLSYSEKKKADELYRKKERKKKEI